MKDSRPNPEKLLQHAKEEEQEQQRGKLKIYLGAAPGVGKTYTMLQDAQAKRAQGLDVVVGVVESHGRKEIEDLLYGLEIIPLRVLEYHNKPLKEFDLDTALKRSPALILIDELAHENVPGSRHTKRWQDIKELLDRGIDVYTTLNVQHIESLNDVIAQITRIHVHETVPDSMLELADTIELVDLSPDDLLKRLQEGKVYIPQQAELAKENFFRKGNLTALRELALRVTAERVDAQIMHYRQGMGIKHIWPTKERILVCVGPGMKSPKIIRAGRRMASKLQAELIAVYIETPKLGMSEASHNNAIHNLRLAEQLGAETRVLAGIDIVKEIINFARDRNVTRIVIGKKIRPRWKDWIFGSLVDELVRESGEIDIYIIHASGDGAPVEKHTQTRHSSLKSYLIAVVITSLATLINFLLYSHVGLSNLAMVYLLGVVIVALFGRVGPANLASVLSVLTFDFFFIPPRFSLAVADTQYFITLIIMFVIAQIISHLTILSRQQAESATHAESHMFAIHSLTRQLASTRGINKLLAIAVRYISENFDSEVMVLLLDNNRLAIRARYRSTQLLSAKELSIAQWVFDLGQPAGLGTDTLSSSDALFVPLLGTHGTIGVLRVRPMNQKHFLIPETMHFLEACANQIALALEVDHLQDQARISELQAETSNVRSALLRSVSHDLRSPLISIMGCASMLIEMSDELDIHSVRKLANNIYSESEQLNRLVNNLLQITYLEAASLKLHKEQCSLNDVINIVLNNLSRELKNKTVHVDCPNDLPDIFFDKILLEQVLENLIDNAIKFTPPESPIEIHASLLEDKIKICVEDRGPGVPADEVDRLFEKFYRGRMITSERGLGLGLALCHSIIQAHGGEIWVENRKEGGAVFCFTLPLHHH
ncbi:MAG: ATP-binding protein [Gammaproteobacteria bacterium]